MDVALGLLAFWPALALGSFLNVVAARVPLRRSVVQPARRPAWPAGRSSRGTTTCPSSRGSCCAAAAAPAARGSAALYPAVELATAGSSRPASSSSASRARPSSRAFFCAVLVAISATDIKHRIVPNRIVLPAAAVVLVAQTRALPEPRVDARRARRLGFLLVAALAYPGRDGHGRRQARAAARRDARPDWSASA